MRIVFHPEAEAELIEAARFYEERSAGLGRRFLEHMDEALDLILEAPDRWAMAEEGLRRYSLRRFPYALYYVQRGDVLRVEAVKHHSRHPEYWKDRL